jgi:2-dehydrotetronate isomerase
MPKFAANLTMMFTEVPFLDRFGAAAEAGFDAVEFQFPYAFAADDIAERLQRHRLRAALFNLFPGDAEKGDRGFAAVPGRSAEFRGSVLQARAYATALGVTKLHVMAGNADRREATARGAYVESLKFAAEMLGEAGIEALIEPINPVDFPGYFLSDFDYATELIHRLKLPNLKLQFDLYHRQRMRGAVYEGLRTLLPIIGHVQVASAPYRQEPGTGELDDFRAFAELDRLGYDGFVGCEYRPAAGTVAGLGWLERARAECTTPKS